VPVADSTDVALPSTWVCTRIVADEDGWLTAAATSATRARHWAVCLGPAGPVPGISKRAVVMLGLPERRWSATVGPGPRPLRRTTW
jgi:hypothetical protein